ncbi:RNA-binding protein CP29B, chloroplastic [Neltuma alba]|uniref:RNA-binding protein CP29B, chloroplastic n=2 Tax=Neltuma alba TaxID=207710 RepID=UPI0010A53D39|nr:RNA-binding protein CP29B, chloroplastic-like [Prosopis alba]XP_028792801.1 RNA-binding protein CP29B, chloroplastic-like [Prosopis alba]
MALFRICGLLSTANLSVEHHLRPLSSFHNSPHPSPGNLSFCCSPSSFHFPPLSLTHPSRDKTKEISHFLPILATVSQEQALTSSPSNVSDDSQPTETQAEEFSRTRLLAQNLPWTSTPEDVRSLFERHGRVLDVELSMYNKTRNRGLAFVEMGSEEEALAALNSLESYEYEGRILRLAYARPKKKKAPPPVQQKTVTFNIFVGNLSYEARAKDLREFFDSGSGSVVSAEVIFHDNPRKSAGYGFVSFKSKREAEAALSEFQGKNFMGRPIRVARSKQFVKQPVEESARSEDESSETSVNGVEADKAD